MSIIKRSFEQTATYPQSIDNYFKKLIDFEKK